MPAIELIFAAALAFEAVEYNPTCTAVQYFDISSLQCGACPDTQVPATDGYSCACDPGTTLTSGSGGFSFGNMQSAPPKLMAQPQQQQQHAQQQQQQTNLQAGGGAGSTPMMAQPGGGFSFGSSATPQAPSMTGPAPNSGGAADFCHVL